MMLPGKVAAWVWRDRPRPLGAAFDMLWVRAANGGRNTGPDGFDFLANYHDWERASSVPLVPWTWIYPTTSPLAGAAALAKVDAPAYMLDVEELVAADTIRRFVAELRRLRPHRPIGFSSYPTRAQFASVNGSGGTWDALVSSCDFGAPQVYFSSQAGRMPQVVADMAGKPVHVAVSPADYSGWLDVARLAVGVHLGVSVWASHVAGWDGWARALAGLQHIEEEPFMAALSDAEQRELLAAARQINGAKGEGQTSFASTIEATLGTVQQLVNEGRAQSGMVVGRISDLRVALLDAMEALPSAHLPAEERQQIAEAVAALVGARGDEQLLDALATRLAA
jgi:hypothetical protein